MGEFETVIQALIVEKDFWKLKCRKIISAIRNLPWSAEGIPEIRDAIREFEEADELDCQDFINPRIRKMLADGKEKLDP